MVIPKDAFAGIALPSFAPARSGYALASGGSVPSRPPMASQGAQGDGLNIINVLDPTMFDQYAASVRGQRMILNVISQNAYQVRNILATEG